MSQILRFDRLLYNLGVFWLFAMTLLIAVAPAPYLHDFAEWLFQGKILALKLTDPQAVTAYTLAPYPVPNSLAPALLAVLCLVFEPILAGKIFLIFLLIGWLLTLRVFVMLNVPEHSHGAVMLLLVSMVVLASFFWYGFVSYQLGLLLLILFFSFYTERWSLSEMVGVGILLFLSHAMIFLVWCLSLGLDGLFGKNQLRRRAFFTLLIIAPLPMWFVLGRQFTGFLAPVADARLSSALEFLMIKLASPAQHGGFRNMIQPDGSSLLENHLWIYGLGALCTLIVVVLLAIFVLIAFLNKPVDQIKPSSRFFYCGKGYFGWWRKYICPDFNNPTSWNEINKNYHKLGLLMIGLYCVAPFNFFGLIDPGGRLLLPLFFLALMVASENAFIWLRRAAIPVAVGVSISVLSYAALIYQSAYDIGYAYQGPAPSKEAPPNHSVIAFNDWAYRNTRFRYFNFRVFSFAHRFRQIQSGDFSGLRFRTGPIISYKPASTLSRDNMRTPP